MVVSILVADVPKEVRGAWWRHGELGESAGGLNWRWLQGGGAPVQYPPPSLERAVAAIFLAGASDAPAWRAKLAAFLFYLLDAGLPLDPAAFMCAAKNPVPAHTLQHPSCFSKGVVSCTRPNSMSCVWPLSVRVLIWGGGLYTA